jgi:predicted nucleic acid-binding protein
MPYLVDSDWVIDFLEGDQEARQLLDSLAGEGIAISVITYMEVYQGVVRDPQPVRTEEDLRALTERLPIVPVSTGVAERCARLREALRTEGRRVNSRALDLLIAATAMHHNLTLVTRNVEDYKDIPELLMYRQNA